MYKVCTLDANGAVIECYENESYGVVSSNFHLTINVFKSGKYNKVKSVAMYLECTKIASYPPEAE